MDGVVLQQLRDVMHDNRDFVRVEPAGAGALSSILAVDAVEDQGNPLLQEVPTVQQVVHHAFVCAASQQVVIEQLVGLLYDVRVTSIALSEHRDDRGVERFILIFTLAINQQVFVVFADNGSTAVYKE